MVYWVVSLLKAPLYKEKTNKKTERTLGTPFEKKLLLKLFFFWKSTMYMYVFYQKPLVLVCAMVYGPRIAYSKRRKQLNKCHLDKKTAEALGHSFYSVKNDINGNPRYVIHWLIPNIDLSGSKNSKTRLIGPESSKTKKLR